MISNVAKCKAKAFLEAAATKSSRPNSSALKRRLFQPAGVSGNYLRGALASSLTTTYLRWQLPFALCHLPVGHQEGSPLVAGLLSNTPFYLLPYKRIRPRKEPRKRTALATTQFFGKQKQSNNLLLWTAEATLLPGNMKLVFPAKLDFLSRFTWSIIINIIIVLTVTIIVTVVSRAMIVMDMTIMVILKSISRLLQMTIITVKRSMTSARIWVSPLKTNVVEGRSAATYWKQSLRNLRKIVGTIFDQFRLWTNMILLDLDKCDLTWVLGLLVPELGSKTASLPSPWLCGGFQTCSKRHLPRGCVACRLKMRTTTEQEIIQYLLMSKTTTTSAKQIECNHSIHLK